MVHQAPYSIIPKHLKKSSEKNNLLSCNAQFYHFYDFIYLLPENGYRYLHNPYSFEKHLLLSKKWRIKRHIPLILSISKNPMKKITYYHVMLNFSIFMTLSIYCEKTVGDTKLKFSGHKFRPIVNTR